jgi:hypothetical protein
MNKQQKVWKLLENADEETIKGWAEIHLMDLSDDVLDEELEKWN